MRKTALVLLALLLAASLFGCAAGNNRNQSDDTKQQTDTLDKQAVTNLVLEFGKKLTSVSLLTPADTVSKSIQDNYGGYVSPRLLDAWVKEPLKAPGRYTSSPWPDRIEVISAKKVSAGAYEVQGEIIEITSIEKTNRGVAARQPITLAVKKIDNRWLIDDVKVANQAGNIGTAYLNTQYGFSITLPESWKGYKVVNREWTGLATGGSQPVETGKMISIRHPLWAEQKPRQDIPIMIFTTRQWNSLQKRDFHIGAAPMGPSELARNTSYVFALPARYNYAFPTGFEEVEKILAAKPLKPFEI